MKIGRRQVLTGAAALATSTLAHRVDAQPVKELTLWSHWAAEMPKREFV